VQEPRVDAGGLIDLVHGRAEAHGELDVVEAPLGRALEVFEDGCLVGGSLAREVLIRDSPEASLLGLQRAHDLVQAGDVVAADGHGLTDGLHRGGEGVVSPWELLEGEARGLDDDIVQGRLKGGRGDLGDVVADLVERVADRQLRSELRDREAGGLGRERRGTGDARVHLDRDDPAVLGVDSELDVAATGLHADLAKNGDALVAHDLELAVRQGHGRGDGDGVAGVDAQGVDVLDGCDDDYVVLRIAHQLELEFLPAEDGLLDQDVGLRGRGEAPAGDPVQVLVVEGKAGTQATHGEGWADDDWQPQLGDGLVDLVHVVADTGASRGSTDLLDDVLELLAILATLDGVDVCTDELDAVLVEDAAAVQLDRGVQRGLAA